MKSRIDDILIKNALDLSETIVFEYDRVNDVMSFADNVGKYMPCATSIASYIEELPIRGKIHPDDIKKAISFFKEGDDDTLLKVEYIRFLDFKGDYPWYQVKGKIERDHTKHTIIVYGTMTMAENQDEIDDASENSNRDPLTLLDGRETVKAKVNNYMADIPDDVVAGMMIIDLDDFEDYRAINGTAAGDEVLLEVSRIIRKALRGADIIGRFAGDEFIVCMRGAHDERIYCERATYIIDSIKNIPVRSLNGARVCASIGISIIYDHEAVGFDVLYDKAELALYRAKVSGKGMFVLNSDELHLADEFKDIRITGREIELVRSILDPINAWAYAVDEKYNLIYANEALSSAYSSGCEGICYAKLKGYSTPCPDCPMNALADKKSSADCQVYSPRLRAMASARITRITLRNRSNVFIIANVKDDIATQIETLSDSSQRYLEAMMTSNSIVWDVNITTNSCIRVQESEVVSVVEKRKEDYAKLRSYFVENVVHPEDRHSLLSVLDPEMLRKSKSVGMPYVHKEVRFLTESGAYKWFSVYAVFGADDGDGKDETVFISARNIDRVREESIEKYTVDENYQSMLKRSEFQMEIALSNERYEHVNELTGIYVFEYDVPDQKYYICSTFDTMFNITDEMLKDEWSFIEHLNVVDEDEGRYRNYIHLVKTEPDTHTITLRFINCYGKAVWFTLTVQTLKGMNNTLTRVTGVLQNVNAEMEVKAELEFRADFDSMTGLFNSDHFYRAARERIHKFGESNFAIISIDIRRFRVINDRFGIEAGNKCLKYMGGLIRRSLPWDAIAGHYQADVFSVLYEYESDQDIFDYMTKLSSDFSIEEANKCGSTLSFGIYKINERDIPVRLMCDRARFAKKEIKGNAFVNYAVYDDRLRLVMREQSEIESEMRMALANNEFVMYLQPKYDSHTEKICGAEALVRWQHPVKGLRMPGDFLPLFENNGFVRNLDVYMWDCAAKYIAHLNKLGYKIPISVNLSRIHIHDKSLLDTIKGIVEKNKIEPRLLELEVTENYFLEDVNELYDCMTKLKEEGFVLEMDDFGSGYSSLNMLRNAPVDVIKIDRFFLDEIMLTSRGRIVVENSIRMSKQLGLTVVAEGVETRDQLEFIRDAGCDIVQGYYYSKPVPVEEFERMLLEER